MGAIENDRDDRLAGRERRVKAVEIDRAVAGQIGGGARDRTRFARIEQRPCVTRESAQERAQILAPALAEIAQQRVEFGARQGRGVGQPGVVAILAGQDRKRDPLFARHRCDPFDAVTPPVEPAEQAQQNHLGMDADAIDPQIDRQGMAQVAQMREAHAWQRVALDRPGRREPGEVGVGERQHENIARRLAQVDWFGDLVERG